MVAANWNQTAEPGPMPIFLPMRSSHFVSVRPLRTMGNFCASPTPMRPEMVLMPCDSAIGTSAGPMEPASIEPDARAVRVSA